MSTLPEFEACLSILLSVLPVPGGTITNTAVLLVVVLVAAGIMHYASPLRLTRVLIGAITSVEKIYLEALETGLLSASDLHTVEMLSTCASLPFINLIHSQQPVSLQLKVSKIRETSLRNSLSHSRTLREFFAGRTFTLLCCIREVKALETHIEVFNSSF
jgi:hypothetical protein